MPTNQSGRGAERLAARAAVDAAAARRDQVDGDAVADRPALDALAERGDPADRLDAERVGKLDREARDALAHVDVEVVERRGGDVDDDLARARRRDRGAPRPGGRRRGRTRGRRRPSRLRSSLLRTPELCLSQTFAILSKRWPRFKPPARSCSPRKRGAEARARRSSRAPTRWSPTSRTRSRRPRRPAARDARRPTCSRRATAAPCGSSASTAAGTDWHDADVAAVAEPAASTRSSCRRRRREAVDRRSDGLGLPIVAIVETADGPRAGAFEIGLGSAPSARCMLGAVDLGLALGLEPRQDGHEILFARSSLVVDSAAAGLRGPVDQVWLDVRDHEGSTATACLAARSAFAARRACTRPGRRRTRRSRPRRTSSAGAGDRRRYERAAARGGESSRSTER